MPHTSTLWCIISPVFVPAPGGGAIYNELLGRKLCLAGDHVVFFVERYPTEPKSEVRYAGPGNVRVRRVFPYRAGRDRKDATSYAAFAAANMEYMLLPSHIRRAAKGYSRVRILVHSSLFHHPTALILMIGALRLVRVADAKVILDVRDYSLPEWARGLLPRFDRVIASSEDLAAHIGNAVPILMPFEKPRAPTDDEVGQVLERRGLRGKRFLLNPNGISLNKRWDVFREFLNRPAQGDWTDEIVVVTVGRERDRSPEDTAFEASGRSVYLGSVPREEVIALMKAALFTVVLSDREAISRSALEAMAVGGRAILPNLKEFNRDCASHVLVEMSGAALLEKINALHDTPMPDYEFSRHEDFVPLYQAL
jgi:glycosyltransferase involved in cell wall biosynthesis